MFTVNSPFRLTNSFVPSNGSTSQKGFHFFPFFGFSRGDSGILFFSFFLVFAAQAPKKIWGGIFQPRSAANFFRAHPFFTKKSSRAVPKKNLGYHPCSKSNPPPFGRRPPKILISKGGDHWGCFFFFSSQNC